MGFWISPSSLLHCRPSISCFSHTDSLFPSSSSRFLDAYSLFLFLLVFISFSLLFQAFQNLTASHVYSLLLFSPTCCEYPLLSFLHCHSIKSCFIQVKHTAFGFEFSSLVSDFAFRVPLLWDISFTYWLFSFVRNPPRRYFSFTRWSFSSLFRSPNPTELFVL